jgi:hypothetical protein
LGRSMFRAPFHAARRNAWLQCDYDGLQRGVFPVGPPCPSDVRLIRRGANLLAKGHEQTPARTCGRVRRQETRRRLPRHHPRVRRPLVLARTLRNLPMTRSAEPRTRPQCCDRQAKQRSPAGQFVRSRQTPSFPGANRHVSPNLRHSAVGGAFSVLFRGHPVARSAPSSARAMAQRDMGRATIPPVSNRATAREAERHFDFASEQYATAATRDRRLAGWDS